MAQSQYVLYKLFTKPKLQLYAVLRLRMLTHILIGLEIIPGYNKVYGCRLNLVSTNLNTFGGLK